MAPDPALTPMQCIVLTIDWFAGFLINGSLVGIQYCPNIGLAASGGYEVQQQ